MQFAEKRTNLHKLGAATACPRQHLPYKLVLSPLNPLTQSELQGKHCTLFR
jgi:hypothetical protein